MRTFILQGTYPASIRLRFRILAILFNPLKPLARASVFVGSSMINWAWAYVREAWNEGKGK